MDNLELEKLKKRVKKMDSVNRNLNIEMKKLHRQRERYISELKKILEPLKNKRRIILQSE